jgi:hypothetical protein
MSEALNSHRLFFSNKEENYMAEAANRVKTPSADPEINMRLTIADRAGIVSRAVAEAFHARREKALKQEAALTERAYKRLFPASVRSQVAEMPEGWVVEQKALKFVVSGLTFRVHGAQAFRLPLKNYYNNETAGSVVDDALRDALTTHFDAKKVIEDEASKVKQNLEAILSRAMTFRQLRDMWPEGKRFYDHLKPRAAAPVPAVQIQDINAALGLKAA